LPYYPPKPEQDSPGRPSPEDEITSASRRRRFLRAGLLCLSAGMVLYGGIRLVSYGLDLSASRKTKYEMMSVMREADPAAEEIFSDIRGTAAPQTQAGGADSLPGDSVNEAGAAPSGSMALSEMSVPFSDVSAAEALSSGLYVTDQLPVVEYENNYQVVPAVQKLKRKSKYVVGWLEMDDLEEPVVQKDNTFFLKHDAMGKKNVNGAIFLDENTQLLTRPYTLLLYGHNMKSGNMFGNLRKYEKFAYYYKHRVFRFDTLFEEGQYVIFSVGTFRVIPGAGKYINLAELQSTERETRRKALSALIDYSLFDTLTDVNEEDQILLLITCNGNDQERLIVAARRLRDGESRSDGYLSSAGRKP